MNLWKTMKARFLENSGKPALTDPNGSCISYGELLDIVEACAGEILAGVPQGSRIAVLSTHTYYDGLSVLSVLAAGCTVIPISLNYGEYNCCKIIEKARPHMLITDMKELPKSIEKSASEICTKVFEYVPNVKQSSTAVKADIEEGHNPAMIMFTSGTTGIPKGAMLSHKNILSNLEGIADYFRVDSKDHILIARPLYHAAVMTGEFLYGMLCGSRISFYTEAFSPKRLLGYIDAVGCTVMCGTPTLFYLLALSKRNMELATLRKIVVSGECLHPQAADKLISAFPNALFYNVFGLTEASPRVSYLAPEYFRKKIGSVGKPLKNVTIRIADENGDQVSAGTIGELIVSGPNVMDGYWDEREQTANRIRNGWLYTGDLAYMDEEGYLFIIGRKDHMIIRAGVNIYPQEIENMLLEDAAIAEVMVWGEADPRYGQRICAAFVPAAGHTIDAAYIMDICRKKLQPYQQPDEIHIIDSLPRNGSGKLVRGRPKGL